MRCIQILAAIYYTAGMIYLGADHRGFNLKEAVREFLTAKGLPVEDKGGFGDPADDYPKFAAAVARAVESDPEARGILICGSGHGMDMVANKFKGIRAALGFNAEVAAQSRADEDANVIVLAADWVSSDEALAIIEVWLNTPFSGAERHRRRLNEIKMIETDERSES